MKAKRLAELLLEHPDFEVRAGYLYCGESQWPQYSSYDIDGVADVGHSDKVIVLDLSDTV